MQPSPARLGFSIRNCNSSQRSEYGIEYAFFDPYIRHPDNHWPLTDMAGFDAFIVMTPHKVFHELYEKHMHTVEYNHRDFMRYAKWKNSELSKEYIKSIKKRISEIEENLNQLQGANNDA